MQSFCGYCVMWAYLCEKNLALTQTNNDTLSILPSHFRKVIETNFVKGNTILALFHGAAHVEL